MLQTPHYSVIIPVYNRPEEIRELLESLTRQTIKDFEVLVVEDGSDMRCDEVVDSFRDKLQISYLFKPNSGPGPSRNFGFKQASGKYLVVFDSDCIVPPHYFEAVNLQRSVASFDAWGGPDRSHSSFTPLQQAMAYTMSSVLTTGGIRGSRKHLGWFQPRSFNMGLSREVFDKTHGFVFSRLAEDIELSIRMKNMGFKSILIPDAYVYHKRRTTLGQFYKQVSNFGRGRVQVGRVHKGAVKVTHWFPSFFTLGLIMLPILYFVSKFLLLSASLAYSLYGIVILTDAYRLTKNVSVALLSVPSAFVQLTGYGTGFLNEWLIRD
jgi:glycosyltransferase involved in cell wall biosynthesis